MEVFADTISFRMSSFRFGVFNLIQHQIKRVVMLFHLATMFGTTIGQDTQYWQFMFGVERQHSIIQQVSAVIGVLVM